jgi:3-deoxy-D-manno-octulosonic-acid transferase
MRIIYNLGILIYTFLARVFSPFSSKARLWASGQKDWKLQLKEKISKADVNLWIHCASLGEFEQGRPLIEEMKKRRPEIKIILTFFSPSGYEIRKNYSLADYVCYLPVDTPGNALTFISEINPAAAVFVKYEFWNNYTTVLEKKNIPMYLVSGIFRPDQHFFKWYGLFFRNILYRFNHIFVQDSQSRDLLKNIGIENVTIAGDTRFDRVVQITGSAREIPQLEQFRGNQKLLLAGSSWKPDEEIIARYIKENPGTLKWVFAPHEIDEANIERLKRLLGNGAVRFSEFTPDKADAGIMIIDNIGMLSSAYRYCHIAAIGGGFGKGIHNILEAASWGVPVVFGPNHKKFREALGLINVRGAMSFSDYDGFKTIIDRWITDDKAYGESANGAKEYVRSNTGATEIILSKMDLKDINRPFS